MFLERRETHKWVPDWPRFLPRGLCGPRARQAEPQQSRAAAYPAFVSRTSERKKLGHMSSRKMLRVSASVGSSMKLYLHRGLLGAWKKLPWRLGAVDMLALQRAGDRNVCQPGRGCLTAYPEPKEHHDLGESYSSPVLTHVKRTSQRSSFQKTSKSRLYSLWVSAQCATIKPHLTF